MHLWHGWYRDVRERGLNKRSTPKNRGPPEPERRGCGPSEHDARLETAEGSQGEGCDRLAGAVRSVIAPRAREVISAYVASARPVARAPPLAWACGPGAPGPAQGPRRTAPNRREREDCERLRPHTEGWDDEVSRIPPQ